MNFCVKLLSVLLVLVMLATTVASCAPQSTNRPTTPNGTTSNNVVVVPPVTGGDDNGNNNGNDNNGNHVGGVVVGNVTAPYIGDVHVSAGVTPDENNQVPSEGVSLESATASATIPGGVQMEEGANELALTINGIKDSSANVELSDTDVSSSLDVHVSGVAAGNLVPMEVKLLAAALKGLNSTSITLYHVENGETIAMTYVPSNEPFTAHNQFKYDPATGDVTLYIASFSEIAIVNDTENAWKGGFDYTWYTGAVAPINEGDPDYIIANADQLAAFGAIVGGMAEGIEQDSFSGKTVKLIADINLGDAEADNNPDLIFYPIGYNSSDGKYEKTGVAVTTGFYNFCGTFDGNGHTIANFYHNTWEMKGDNNYYDATLQYYRDGMGLFGKVYGGTVKNLTVSNFSSDGEYTTTGVIAAYADGATFENISIFNCNPRVYNIGNGGIVGCVGWYAKEAGLKTTFTNITVDNTNKISALWGSYDVACGGIVGQYYPTSGQTSANKPANGGIEFTNCHVSAIMDVYNDVCANYQYYAYRYTGMLIGSVRENETIDGRVYPKMDGITAKNCTVHFGTWNDYYYCEIIDNTTASYTHDYQMSRLTEIKAIDGTTITYLDGTTGTVPASGRANYVIVDYTKGHGTENATCYHFKDGAVWTHDMGGIQEGIDENGDGQDDLKEDKQHIYLEFNNLVTGYGWGVTSYGLTNLSGVNNMDIIFQEGNPEGSVEKFKGTGNAEFETGSNVSISDIFQAIENSGVEIKNDQVIVTVSPVTGSTAKATVKTADNWEDSYLELSGIGALNVTISDYYFCKSTTVTINVTPTHKFANKFTGNFLYRVGNQNAISLGSIFTYIEGKPSIINEQVTVAVNNCTFTPNTTDWTKGTLNFSGYAGIATIKIKDSESLEREIKVEIVDGTNVTGLSGTISGNVVLLNDCEISSLTVGGRNTVYGNGFTATYSGNGQYLNNGLKQGIITVSENGMLDNLRIVAPVYPKAYMYYGSTLLGDYVQGGPKSEETTNGTTKTRYHYQLSAVALSGNATISNCYIYGGRNNIFVNTGNVTIKDTILECGTVANMQIQSNASHTITLENLTTIQYQVNPTIGSDDDKKKVMLGAGILVGPETTENPSIVLNGTLEQYNWVTSDDANAVSDTKITKAIIEGALNATAYNHTVNGKTASNLGIIYMNKETVNVQNNTGLPYKEGDVAIKMSGNTVNGKAYSLQGATAEQIYSDIEKADRTTVNSYYQPQFSYPSDLGGQLIPDDGGDEFLYREGDTIYVMFPSGDSKTIDLATLINISKYTGQEMSITITCKNSKGDFVAINGSEVTLSSADTYTVTYTFIDELFYDKDGNTIDSSIEYSWTVELNVALKDTASPDARFEFDATKQKMGYYKPGLGDVKQYLPFLAGLKIYDYNGQTEYLRFDGSKDFNKIASITITGYASNKASVEIKLTDGGIINTQFLARANSGGGSTYTGKIKTSNNTVYFVTDSGTSNKDTTTTAAYWYVDFYKFTGNNGVAIQSGQQTFNSTGSSQSTPSGSFSTSIKYTVSYNANGGNCGQTTGYATSASAAVTLPTPTRSGYIFAGWYTAASGGTRVGGAGDSYTPSANVTLYAQWGKPCNVTYNANGGSCGTTSEKYTGTALTLPTPTRDGYWFIGWYDAAEGGNKIGDAGAKYNPTNEITLYAHWQEAIKYTVTYNANGGSCGTASATYEGTALTLPTPTRTGYTFNGWYTAASGGTKIGDAGATYVPSASITLYAQWTIKTYTITVTTSNATVSGVTNGQKVEHGTSITITVKYSESSNKKTTVNGTTVTLSNNQYTFTVEENVTINASSEAECVTPDTLITLADGTQVRVDSLTGNEMLLVWNMETGKFDVAPIMFLDSESEAEYEIVHLYFSDGTDVKVIYEHGFWDYDLNRYVYLDRNAADYIGHTFAKQNGDKLEKVQLVDVVIETEVTTAWSPVTVGHLCYFVNGMLSMPGGVGGLFNIFEVDPETMTYDYEQLAKDIETYGLFTYEELNAICPLTEEMFNAAGGAYLKISIGKGNLTMDELIAMITRYSKYI